ncbi:hypothetical protein DCC62_04320 [candidate division KSB1 bacterium]|nr:MAG: hypothetical protein DCC62_04320 [candidate division KSB1 bacterium]
MTQWNSNLINQYAIITVYIEINAASLIERQALAIIFSRAKNFHLGWHEGKILLQFFRLGSRQHRRPQTETGKRKMNAKRLIFFARGIEPHDQPAPHDRGLYLAIINHQARE